MKLLKSHALIAIVLEIVDVRPEKENENEKEKGREKGIKKGKARSREKNPAITISTKRSKMEAARTNNKKQAARKRKGNWNPGRLECTRAISANAHFRYVKR